MKYFKVQHSIRNIEIQNKLCFLLQYNDNNVGTVAQLHSSQLHSCTQHSTVAHRALLLLPKLRETANFLETRDSETFEGSSTLPQIFRFHAHFVFS